MFSFKRRGRITPKVDPTPLIDCAFTLIIFFAVSTTLITTRSGMKVNLPQAATVDKLPQHTQISIAEDRSVYFEDLQVNDESLGFMVKSRLDEKPDASFVIGAEQNVPYERLVTVLDIVRGAGGTKLALQARKQNGTSTNTEPATGEEENR